MRLDEVESGAALPNAKELLGLVKFLDGRAQDTNAQKQISKAAFIGLAKDLEVNITPINLADVIAQPPLSNVLEPLDPNSDMITFKGATTGPTAMPVNRAQDIVAASAKAAMKRGMKQ